MARWRPLERLLIAIRHQGIRQADIRRVQEWIGHADIQTTMKYLHYQSRKEDAELVARAFQVGSAQAVDQLSGRD